MKATPSAPEAGERLTHRRLPPAAGRVASPAAKCTSIRLPARDRPARRRRSTGSASPACRRRSRGVMIDEHALEHLARSRSSVDGVADARPPAAAAASRSGRTNSRPRRPPAGRCGLAPRQPAEGRLDLRLAVAAPPTTRPVEQIVLADEGGDEGRRADGCRSRARGRPARHSALAHHRDAVGHGQRLALVVGDVDEGDAGALLDRRAARPACAAAA